MSKRSHWRLAAAAAWLAACAAGAAPALRGVSDPATLAAADRLLADGGDAFARGDVSSAAVAWDKAAKGYAAAGSGVGRARALRNLAAAQQALGQYKPAAIGSLLEAKGLIDPATDRAAYVGVLGGLGAVHTFLKQYEPARAALEEALELTPADGGDVRARAGLLNNLANLHAAETGTIRARLKYSPAEEERDKALGDGKQDAAFREYAEAADSAARAGDVALEAKALANAAVSAVRDGRADRANEFDGRALAKLSALPDSHEKASLLTTVGRTDGEAADADATARPALVRRAADALNRAAEAARNVGDGRAESYAVGYLGALYEHYGQADDAQSLARRAVFLAQKARDNDSLYRWQWLNARLLKKQDRPDDAIAAYARAIGTELAVQSDKALGFGNGDTRVSFRREVAPAFYQAADLLLQRAARPGRSAADQQADLRAARDTIEQLKSAELQDYFKDPCESTVARQEIGAIAANTTIVYAIPLEDRLEILLDLPIRGADPSKGASAGHSLWRLDKPPAVGSAELEKVVENFRRKLERRATNGYVTGAQQLYDWLIRPIEPVLRDNAINTLVFVPDGALRTIPMAALYDGEQFLIQKYAIAVTPSLTLTDAKPLDRRNLDLLVSGLSEAVQGYAPLPNVLDEVQSIMRTVGPKNSSRLLNEQFRSQSFADKLDRRSAAPYPIVHIASHGEFKGDVNQTFVLTFNDRLTVTNLQQLIQPLQFVGRPVELLTLSACQTAAGDDRAALGLAGLGVKAGARSAVASLWYVNDTSSVELISEFYRQLYANPTLTKAEALRRAQLKLLADPDLSHPIYWAPYLMIGNWL